MKPRPLFGLCAAATLSWSMGARADGEDLAGLLDESVVTAASNTAETGRDAPATSTVITGESLRKYGARTLAEAMDMLALGTMSGRNAGGVEMGARGLTIAGANGEHFLLLLDGARVNDFLHGNSPFEISKPGHATGAGVTAARITAAHRVVTRGGRAHEIPLFGVAG